MADMGGQGGGWRGQGGWGRGALSGGREGGEGGQINPPASTACVHPHEVHAPGGLSEWPAPIHPQAQAQALCAHTYMKSALLAASLLACGPAMVNLWPLVRFTCVRRVIVLVQRDRCHTCPPVRTIHMQPASKYPSGSAHRRNASDHGPPYIRPFIRSIRSVRSTTGSPARW